MTPFFWECKDGSLSNQQLPLQVVWSTGAKSLILWDAYTGAYLGSINRSSEADLEKESQRWNSERDERYVPRLQIDHRRVPPFSAAPNCKPQEFHVSRKEGN